MGDGTKENPYTREDVLKLIKENGDTAERLDLSSKFFEDIIKLNKLNLDGINFENSQLKGANLSLSYLRRANLWDAYINEADLGLAHLEGANLQDAHLENADLIGAYLEGAELRGTHLEGADFRFANLKNIHLYGASISSNTRFQDVDWGNFILEDEDKKDASYLEAMDSYRILKQWHTSVGLYDIAGIFFYREMEAKRKALRMVVQAPICYNITKIRSLQIFFPVVISYYLLVLMRLW
jgi:hypothetical protein